MKVPDAAPSDLGLTSTGDPTVDAALMNAAMTYNVPPAVMFATAQQESSLDPTAVGDQGTSFGLYQEHEGGELGTIANAEDPIYAANLFAQTVSAQKAQNPNATWGQLAAAAQRPANQSSYAASVNSMLGQAGNLPAVQASQVLGAKVSSALMTPGGENVAGSTTGGSDFFTGIGKALTGNNQSQIAAYILGQSAQQISQGQLSEAQSLAQAELAPSALSAAAANLTSNTGYTKANALANVKGTQLQEQGLASQVKTAAQQQASETQQYQQQLGQFGVQQQQIGVQQAELANQSAQLQYQYPLQIQQQEGAAAASGASNTVGNQEAQAQITAFNGPGGFQQQQLGLQGQGLGLQSQSTSIQQRLAQLGQQSEVSGYKGQQQQFANSQQQLQLAAQQAGIPVQQANSQLAYGLQQLGVQYDPTQFIGQAATAQSGIAGDYAAALSAAAVAGGLSPQFFSSLTGGK